MKKITILLLLACLGTAPFVSGQDVDIKKLPGYVNLEDLKLPLDAECTTEIDLGPGILGMLKSFSDEEDKSDVSGLFSIRVKSYDIQLEHVKEVRDIISRIEEKLKKDSWENVLRTKDREGYAVISVKPVEGKSMGALIMTVDNDEATFVNIVGSIDFAKLTELGLGLNDSTMNVLRHNWDEK